MSEPKMYWKASHKCYYVTINRKQTRLDPNKTKARELYHRLMLNHAAVKEDCPVAAILDRFLEWCEKNREPSTYDFYHAPLRSFSKFIGRLKVKDLRVYHVTHWLDELKENKRGKKISENYLHNLERAVKAPFSWAVKQEYLVLCKT